MREKKNHQHKHRCQKQNIRLISPSFFLMINIEKKTKKEEEEKEEKKNNNNNDYSDNNY